VADIADLAVRLEICFSNRPTDKDEIEVVEWPLKVMRSIQPFFYIY
jgi:hypothetical protein